MEIQVTSSEIELSIACRYCRPFLVFGDKPEISFTLERWIRYIISWFRVDPPTTSNESTIWVIDDYILVDRLS